MVMITVERLVWFRHNLFLGRIIFAAVGISLSSTINWAQSHICLVFRKIPILPAERRRGFVHRNQGSDYLNWLSSCATT
jgi:hypothetical protein